MTEKGKDISAKQDLRFFSFGGGRDKSSLQTKETRICAPEGKSPRLGLEHNHGLWILGKHSSPTSSGNRLE